MKSKLKISTMTGKMAAIRSVCTNTLTNPFCQAMQKTDSICKSCYSQRMLLGVRRNCAPAWERNSQLLADELMLENELPKLKDDVFRLQAHGEVSNVNHAINLMNLVKSNPGTLFAWFTKRKDILTPLLKEGKPANLIMVFSNAKVDDPTPAVPEFFDKVFSVYTKAGQEKLGVTINCGAISCRGCMKCYSFNKISVVNELLK
jgi:hypothetical protein